MNVTVWRRCTFDAAHQLSMHNGVCSRLHGHTYTVEVGVVCPIDETTGMGIDLIELKTFLYQEVIARFDHRYLNDHIAGQPTAELIACTVLDAANRVFPGHQTLVRIYESPDGWVEVSR